MSSNELATIYRNAAAIVKAKLSSLAGIEEVLAELGRRIPDSEQDPRVHRDLFFEPRIDAQQLGVPVTTAEKAAIWLQRLGILRLWVRVRCPEVEEHEDGTILETDDPCEFDLLASRSCDYCGRHHDLDEDNCDTVYAINTTQKDDVQRFDYSRLVSSSSLAKSDPTGLLAQGTIARCETISGQVAAKTALSPLIVVALQANRNAEPVPTPARVWWNAWGGPIVVLLTYLVLIIPIVQWCGQIIACVVSVVVLGVIWLVVRGQVLAKLAPTVVQRTAMYLGFPIATCCITAGVTGLRFNAAAGEGQPWWTRIEFGDQSNAVIAAGVLILTIVLLFVWAYDWKRGWITGA